jgi:hypothetical protein
VGKRFGWEVGENRETEGVGLRREFSEEATGGLQKVEIISHGKVRRYGWI